MAVASLLRGLPIGIQPTAAPYWFINYRDGFVRRALLGEVFGAFVDQSDPARVMPMALAVHLTACALLILALLAWLGVALRRRTGAAMCCATFVLFAGSQFLPTLAYDAGFLDVYDYLLVLTAAVAVLRGRPWIAGVIGFAGPFLHDGFIFVWLTLVILAVWRMRALRSKTSLPGASFADVPRRESSCADVTRQNGARRGSAPAEIIRTARWSVRGLRRVTFLITPFVATALVYFLPSAAAGVAQMRRAPLPPTMKEMFAAYELNQTLSESLRILAWKYTWNFPNFLMAAVFFGFPAAVSVVAAAVTMRHMRDRVAVTLATLAPASILIVGWDLSRFLVATAFTNALAILFMNTVQPFPRPSRPAIAACWFVGALCFAQPLMYAYFEVASVKPDAPVSFAHTPLGTAVTRFATLFSRHIGPRVVPDVGDEDPPGNVWREEEDAWRNVWTRRPGTNIFDAIGRKGGITGACVLRITRGGDRVRVVRAGCGDGNDMMYLGVITGSEVSGTYPGGVWHAWIER